MEDYRLPIVRGIEAFLGGFDVEESGCKDRFLLGLKEVFELDERALDSFDLERIKKDFKGYIPNRLYNNAVDLTQRVVRFKIDTFERLSQGDIIDSEYNRVMDCFKEYLDDALHMHTI